MHEHSEDVGVWVGCRSEEGRGGWSLESSTLAILLRNTRMNIIFIISSSGRRFILIIDSKREVEREMEIWRELEGARGCRKESERGALRNQ